MENQISFPVKEMMDRYCFFRRKYMYMFRKKETGELIITWGDNLEAKQVWEHFNGNIALCVKAGPRNTKFLSFDVDLPEPEVVHKVVDTLADLGIPREKIYVSTSGGKGYHVDIFFMASIRNWKAKELYDLVIYFGGLNPAKVEYRPTDGQSIKLPLGIHQKTGKRCWFVDRETLEPIEDFDYIKTTEKIHPDLIDSVIKQGNRRRFDILFAEMPEEEQKPTKRTVRNSKSPEGYDIVTPGTRHRKMLEYALFLYRIGGDYESIRRGLEEWYYRQNMSLISASERECLRDISEITAWVMRKGRRQELGKDDTHEYHTKIRIYETDAKRIIQGDTKSARLLAFLVTVYCDKYGFCGLSAAKLCQHLNINSNKTVVEAEKCVAELKLFSKQQGGLKNMGGHLKKVTNKYRFPMDYDRGGEFIEIDGLVTAENIYELYIRTLAALLDEGDAKSSLTAKEFKDWRMMRDAMAEGCDSDGGREAGAESVSAQSGD